jgi:hypothetical protein
MPRLVVLCLTWLALALPAAAQDAASRLKVYLTSGVVRMGDRVQIVVSVEDTADARLVDLPEVEGLEIGPPVGPSVNQSIATRNGRTVSSREIVYGIPVRALRAGEYTLPSFTVAVDGERVPTPELTLTAVQDMRGEELGLLRITPSSSQVVEGQPFSIELVLGWDAAVDRRINRAGLSLPWWGALPGVLALDSQGPRAGARTLRLPLNGREYAVVEEIEPVHEGGRTFRAFRLLRSFTATRSGTLQFPESYLEFGHGDDSIFASRSRDETYFVQAPAFAVDIVALPEAGRPIDYGGAIGSLAVRADAGPRDVDAGESIKLTLTVTGQGNLEFFTAPDPSRDEAFAGFRFFGKTESKDFDRREVVYDVAPLSSAVTEIPPLRLSVYDPEAGSYVELATEPIPIRVRALAGATGLSDPGGTDYERDLRDLADATRGAGGGGRPGIAAVLAALLAVPALALVAARVRSVRGDPHAPLERRRRRALRALRRDLAASAGARDDLAALCTFLAARSREGDGAWIGRDVAAWARAAGARLSAETTAELQRLLDELERAAFGSGVERPPRERALGLARCALGEGL